METIEDYKTDFLKYGGSPELIKDFKDLKTSKSLVDMQRKIFELKSGSNIKVKDDSVKQAFKELEELKSKDISLLDLDSDEYREYQNKITEHENKIRLQLGLSIKPYLVLDSTLENLVNLDNGMYGEACTEFLKSQGKATKEGIEDRLNQLVFVQQREKEIEDERIELIMKISEKLNFLSGFLPQQYNIDKQGNMIPNKVYIDWKEDLFNMKRQLDKRIRLEKSLEDNMDIKADKRGSIYKLFEKVNSLIQKYDLKEN